MNLNVLLSMNSQIKRVAKDKMPVLLATLLMTCLISVAAPSAQGQTRKLAFVVGVSEYQKTGLTNLKYAHKDATELSDELAKHGFEVARFIGKDARTDKVRKALTAFIKITSGLNKNDIVLVSFSGHGVQKMVSQNNRLVEAPFICLYDTLVSKPETMISLNSVIEELTDNSGCNSNLLLIDACRNNPDKGARTLDGGTVKELPTKISLLFSSAPGQKSYESEKAEQGVFTHVLLKGLRGEAKDRRGKIGWLQLASYIESEIPYAVEELMESKDVQQRVNLVGNITSSALIAYPAATEAYASLKAGKPDAKDYLDHAKKYKGAVSEFDALEIAIIRDHDPVSTEAMELILDRFADNQRILSVTRYIHYPTQLHFDFLNKLKKATITRQILGLASLSEVELLKTLEELNTALDLGLKAQAKIPAKTRKLLASASSDSRQKKMEEILEMLSRDYDHDDIESRHRYRYGGASTIGEAAESKSFVLKNLSLGKIAPDIEGVDLEGKKFKLSDYRGKVILLDFWAHW